MLAVLYIVLHFCKLCTAPKTTDEVPSLETSAKCGSLRREDCSPSVCSWSHGNRHPLPCAWRNGRCTAYSSTDDNDGSQSVVNTSSTPNFKLRATFPACSSSRDSWIAKSGGRKMASVDSAIFVNFLSRYYVATKLHNWARCCVERTDEPGHTVDYIGLRFTNENTLLPCYPYPECDSDSEVVIQAENAEYRIFCFDTNRGLRTQKWSNNNTWFELAYNHALQCCPSDSPPETRNGNISLILRITLSPDVFSSRVESISNYNSLLSCNSKSDPVVIDVTYRSRVEHIQYIDLRHSKFECNSSKTAPGLDPHLVVPVSSNVTCRLHSIKCLTDPEYTLDTCVNDAAKQYLRLEAVTQGPQCVKWADAFSKSAVRLISGDFLWVSQAITTTLNDAKCSFKFRSVMTCPGSELYRNESAAVELRVLFNCSATKQQCGYPGRGTCNHTSLQCQCKAACHSPTIHYGGEQCEEDPWWCKNKLKVVGIAVGSAAFLFTIIVFIVGCIYRDRLAKHCKCCSKAGREGYEQT